jgi:nucleoside-diphosphate-sugar epimerase
MILVTGGTGLVGAHLLLYLIESESLGVEKYAQFIEIRQLSKKQSPYLSFMTNYPCLTL